MTNHKVGTQEEWQAARDELLAEEKELTRRNDELAREAAGAPLGAGREGLRFETEAGTKSLAELFDGRSQLLIYHFMFGPAYAAGCTACSSIADTIDPNVGPPGGARRDHDAGLARPAREAPGVQEADGLGHRLGSPPAATSTAISASRTPRRSCGRSWRASSPRRQPDAEGPARTPRATSPSDRA